MSRITLSSVILEAIQSVVGRKKNNDIRWKRNKGEEDMVVSPRTLMLSGRKEKSC